MADDAVSRIIWIFVGMLLLSMMYMTGKSVAYKERFDEAAAVAPKPKIPAGLTFALTDNDPRAACTYLTIVGVPPPPGFVSANNGPPKATFDLDCLHRTYLGIQIEIKGEH